MCLGWSFNYILWKNFPFPYCSWKERKFEMMSMSELDFVRLHIYKVTFPLDRHLKEKGNSYLTLAQLYGKNSSRQAGRGKKKEEETLWTANKIWPQRANNSYQHRMVATYPVYIFGLRRRRTSGAAMIWSWKTSSCWCRRDGVEFVEFKEGAIKTRQGGILKCQKP